MSTQGIPVTLAIGIAVPVRPFPGGPDICARRSVEPVDVNLHPLVPGSGA